MNERAAGEPGSDLEAMHSLAAETTVLAPIAVVVLGILVARGETTFLDHGTGPHLAARAGRGGHRRAAAPLRGRRAAPAARDRRPDPVRHPGAAAARRGARARRARQRPAVGRASASSGWRWCCSASTRCTRRTARASSADGSPARPAPRRPSPAPRPPAVGQLVGQQRVELVQRRLLLGEQLAQVRHPLTGLEDLDSPLSSGAASARGTGWPGSR